MDRKRRQFVLGLGAAALVPACAGTRFVPSEQSGFVRYTLATPQGPHSFFIYRPRQRPPGQKLPVIVYLHGGGERGADGVPPTQVGLGPVVRATLGYFPFVVVFPQCAAGSFWTMPAMAERALAALDVALRDFDGDPERIYVTGNSMGGYGTWLLAARYPGRFAALAPICGGVKPPPGVKVPEEARLVDFTKDVYAQVAQRIGPVPAWIFHGERDWLVPPAESRRMAAAMRAATAPGEPPRVRLTLWPGVGHAAEEPTYASPELFEWFLQQRRGQPSPDAGGPEAGQLPRG
ncbi:MAG: phospholipase [Polyangia bacterium]